MDIEYIDDIIINSVAYHQGLMGSKNGLEEYDNPYKTGSADSRDWRLGLEDGYSFEETGIFFI
jgi:hypothetical protein